MNQHLIATRASPWSPLIQGTLAFAVLFTLSALAGIPEGWGARLLFAGHGFLGVTLVGILYRWHTKPGQQERPAQSNKRDALLALGVATVWGSAIVVGGILTDYPTDLPTGIFFAIFYTVMTFVGTFVMADKYLRREHPDS